MFESLGRESFNQYVSSGGQNCPFCGRANLTFGDIEVDNCMAHQSVSCEDCGKKWEDRYILASVEFERETPLVESKRIIRGGSYCTKTINISYRHHVNEAGLRVINAGFRTVRRKK